ncbi:MAG: hypothetical protein V4671_27190 [Armatimonadota bacterium]
MAEGQQLRWWQEQDEQSQVSHRASERVTVVPAPLLPSAVTAPVAEPVTLTEEFHDTWEDLEAEAVRRAEQAKIQQTESVSFFMDKSAALVKHRREGRTMAWIFGSVILMIILLPLSIFFMDSHHHYSPPPLGAICGFAGVFSIFCRRRKWLEENEKPTVRLSPQGIDIHTAMQPDISLLWKEITEVTPKGSRKKRALHIRASKRRRFVIEERDLPLTVDALAARIAVYETARDTV